MEGIIPDDMKDSPLWGGLRVVRPSESEDAEKAAKQFGIEERTPTTQPTMYGPEPILYGPRPARLQVSDPEGIADRGTSAPGEPETYLQLRR